MSNRDFEIEMRLKADFTAAQAQLEQTRESIDRITVATAAANAESAAGSAGAGGTNTAAIEAETAALNGNVTAREAVAAASLATRGAAAGEIALLGELEDRLALGAASFEELAKTEALLDLAMGKHLLTTEEYNAALVALNGTQATLDRTIKGGAVATVAVDAEKNAAALDKFTFASQGAVREYGVLAGELARGNTARLEGSLFTLANRTGILASLFSPLGLAIIATTAAMGGLAIAYYNGAQQEEAMNKALILSGNYAGVTRGQMEALAQAVGKTSGSFSDAYEATTKLVASGKITGDVLENATKAAVSYAQLTGESIDKAVAVMVKIGEEPVRAVKELDSSLHFLTGTQYDQIKAMDKAGDSAGATALAMGLLTKAMDDDIVKAKEQEGTLETLFDRWVKGLGTIKQGLLDIGKDTALAEQLQDAKSQFEYYQKVASNPISKAIGLSGIYTQDAQDQLAKVLALTKQINGENNAAASHGAAIQVEDNYKKATDDLDRLSVSVDKNAEKQAKLNQLYKDYEAIQAHNPNDPRLTDYSLERLTVDIENRYADKKPKSTGVDRAQLHADVQATQDALNALNDAYTNSEKILEAQHKAGLISDAAYFQGQLDDINNLEAAEVARLDQEKAQVATHGTNAAQRIAIDQKVASIEAQIAKVQADAAAKRTEIEAQQHQLDLKRTQQLHQVQEEYDNAIGDTLDAQLLKLQDDFDKRMAEMVAASNTAGIEIMKKLLPVEVAKAQLADLMTKVDQSFNAESSKQQAIQTQLDQHTITEADARAQIVDLYKSQTAAVEKLLPEMERLALLTNDKNAIATLEQIKQKLREMSDQTSLLVQKVGDVFEGAFSNALDSLIERTATLGQAVRQFVVDIAKGVGEFASQQLAQLARAKLQSLFKTTSAAPEAIAITSAAASAAPVLGGGVIAGGAEAATTIAVAFEAAGSTVAAEIAAAMASGGGGAGGGFGGILSSLFSSGAGAGDAGSAISSAASLFGDGFFAEGGQVSGPGTGTSDSIFARLSHGEFVARAAVVAQPGALAFLSDFNNRGMQAIEDRDRAFAGADISRFRAPPQYRFAEGGLARAAASMKPIVKLRLINAIDAHEVGRVYAESADGEQTVVNHIARNPNKIKRALGG